MDRRSGKTGPQINNGPKGDFAARIAALAKLDSSNSELGNSEEESLKAQLAGEIGMIITARKLTQQRAAELLGLRQPDVSAIVTGRTVKFSVGRLLRCLDRLDHRVHISVRPKQPHERRLP